MQLRTLFGCRTTQAFAGENHPRQTQAAQKTEQPLTTKGPEKSTLATTTNPPGFSQADGFYTEATEDPRNQADGFYA